MHLSPQDKAQLQQLLETAKDILVVTHKNPTTDSLAAGLALYLTLPQLGKRVTIASPDKVTVQVSNLIGIDKVTNSVGGGKNFVISLDYAEGSIEKVSYNIEGNKFNLVIEPRPGFGFSEDKVSFSNSGGHADVIIVIGANHLEDLDPLYAQHPDIFRQAAIINIDTKPSNTRFGKLNLVYPGLGSISEIMTFLLRELGVTLDADSATNLLSGITESTHSFTSSMTTPDSFEAAALLMRTGASRPHAGTTDGLRSPSIFTPPPSFGTVSPLSLGRSRTTTSSKPVDEETPPDWLKPKIFKSRGRSSANPPADYTPSEGKGRSA